MIRNNQRSIDTLQRMRYDRVVDAVNADEVATYAANVISNTMLNHGVDQETGSVIMNMALALYALGAKRGRLAERLSFMQVARKED